MNDYKISAKDFLAWREGQLNLGGCQVDLDWLLDMSAGINYSSMQKIYYDSNRELILKQSLESLSELWKIHIKEHVPMQYLIGRCTWRDFELEVFSGVFIPRPETEILVDVALQNISSCQEGTWADLGTGSGAIAIALARELPNWVGHAVDCSPEALSIADRNFKQLAEDSLPLIHLGNWWEPLKPWWGNLNLVVSNPPYIPKDVLDKLKPEVRNHEPYLALCGGQDGLEACREIVKYAQIALSKDGLLILEHHYDQSEDILDLMNKSGLKEVDFAKDLEGIRRFAIGRNI